MTRSTDPAPPPPRSNLVPVAIGCVLLLCVFQAWWAIRIDGRVAELAGQREALEAQLVELDGVAARVEKAALVATETAEQLEVLRKDVAPVISMGNDWEIVVEDVSRMDARLARLITAFEKEFGVEVDNPAPVMPEIDWTQPELFAAAKKAAAEYGIELSEDEVRVKSRIALRQGLLEYFAVLKGGKEHEALISIGGNTPADGRRPAEFGARLNNALLALGFPRGTPIRFTPRGTRPAQGETVHVLIEWEHDGKKQLVRAEDLIWNRITGATMEPGKWVYVGSSYVPGDEEGEMLFAADLTAEAIATYSAVNTIIDNTSRGAADDTVFVVASPRIPEGVTDVTLVLRRAAPEGVHVFAEAPEMDMSQPLEEPGGDAGGNERSREDDDLPR